MSRLPFIPGLATVTFRSSSALWKTHKVDFRFAAAAVKGALGRVDVLQHHLFSLLRAVSVRGFYGFTLCARRATKRDTGRYLVLILTDFHCVGVRTGCKCERYH